VHRANLKLFAIVQEFNIYQLPPLRFGASFSVLVAGVTSLPRRIAIGGRAQKAQERA